jgi:hypothetical protein
MDVGESTKKKLNGGLKGRFLAQNPMVSLGRFKLALKVICPAVCLVAYPSSDVLNNFGEINLK